jgi:uncharacterized membrane protein YhaH (DUF805 family)
MDSPNKGIGPLNFSPINAKKFQNIFLSSLVLTCVAIVLMGSHTVALNLVGAVLLAAAQIWFMLGIFRRNKDIGNPWFYSFICIVPVIGIIYFFWLMMASSAKHGRTNASA